MSSSEARILANRKNAELSTGPRTDEGKERSRANALKHGLTGAGIVLPQADAAEVDRRSAAFARELHATGDLGHALARRAALNSVRMERGADQEAAALTEQIRRVRDEFVPPDGVSDQEAAQLRDEACRRAMFDPSKEATLARRYEAAAERGFFKAVKELQRMAQEAKAEHEARVDAAMGSFLAAQAAQRRAEPAPIAKNVTVDELPPRRPSSFAQNPPMTNGVDVPLTIGRRC